MERLMQELQLSMIEIIKFYGENVPIFSRTDNSPALLNAIWWEKWQDILYDTIMDSVKNSQSDLWKAYTRTKKRMWGRRVAIDDIWTISQYICDNSTVKNILLNIDRQTLNPIAEKLWLKEYRSIYKVSEETLNKLNYSFRKIKNWNKITGDIFITSRWDKITWDDVGPVNLELIHPILLCNLLNQKGI